MYFNSFYSVNTAIYASVVSSTPHYTLPIKIATVLNFIPLSVFRLVLILFALI